MLLDAAWTAHDGGAVSTLGLPGELLRTLQDSDQLLWPPKCQGRVGARPPALFTYSSLTALVAPSCKLFLFTPVSSFCLKSLMVKAMSYVP